MNKSDNINFRGKFKLYDTNGSSYLYRIGDTVTHNGKKYVAIKPTQSLIPGTSNGNSAWEEISSSGQFYFQDQNPYSPAVGDRWFRPSSGVLYNYVEENGNKFWIEISGSFSPFTKTVTVIGPTYASNIYDEYIGVSYGGTCSIILPPNPDTGKNITVKDESGHAGDPYKYITISGATGSDTIDRQSSAIININNASLQFVYRNGWRIV